MYIRKILVAALVLVSTRTMAQYETKKSVFGFTLSPSVAWLGSKENPVESDGTKVGFNYGFLADIRFDDNYYFSTGVNISQTGGKLRYLPGQGFSPSGNPTPGGSYDFKFQHVNVPVSLKLKTNERNDVSFWGQFGTYVGIKMGSRLSDAGMGLDKENISSSIQPLNMGLLLGAGAEFLLDGKTRAMAGLNFENGFVDATRNSRWNDGKMVINNLVLRLGVFF